MQIFIYCKITLHVWASIAPIIRSTEDGNCNFWYRSYHVSRQQPSSSVA